MLKKSFISLVLLACVSTASAQNYFAARRAANSTTNACSQVPSFYWEIGNATGSKVSGSKGTKYYRDTTVSIASATKMLTAAYFLQDKKDISTEHVALLNFTSGYTNFEGLCSSTDTVASCLSNNSGNTQDPNTIGKFSYSGGHMQRLGTLVNMGDFSSQKLSTEYSRVLGSPVTFTQPLLAGGAKASPATYAMFLQNVVSGKLTLNKFLGANQVCTNPATCTTAVNSPAAPRDFNYSLGHWVETSVDGAYSSAGALGFYPWISKDKVWYGIVSTQTLSSGSGGKSADCGAAIRKAFLVP